MSPVGILLPPGRLRSAASAGGGVSPGVVRGPWASSISTTLHTAQEMWQTGASPAAADLPGSSEKSHQIQGPRGIIPTGTNAIRTIK